MAWKGQDKTMFIKCLEDGTSQKRLSVSALEFVNHLLTPADYADTCVELYGLDMSRQELCHQRIAFQYDGVEGPRYKNTIVRALTKISLPSGIDPQFIHVQLGRNLHTTQV